MLFWAGLVLILIGIVSIGFDRWSSHLLYGRVSRTFWRFLDATTHLAKASHWLILAAIAYAFTRSPYALAFLLSLIAGSAVLHVIKLVLGRRRPRDDMEMGLYGFMPLSFDLRYNSFPSGHALTIMCVAAIASAAYPALAPLWFALAAWLGLTRALLTAHYLSDVLVGAGIGLISAHETVIHVFPQLAPAWF
jgi:membrane-associated phospholipid phosphatase